MTFGTVAILGPGLIGGSLALALAERGLAEQLKVYSRRDTVFPAIKAKLPDAHLTTNIVEAVSDADVVVLCLPVETMAEAAGKILHGLKPGALVTDVGSVKESVDRELGKIFAGKALWIGSHPMAGSEKSGFTVARADLFAGATVILTPTKLTAAGAEDRAAQFWKAVGGRILKLDPKSHDVAVAQISHLPHLVAAALLSNVSETSLPAAGPGLRDTTRVASGSPELWTEIIWANREAIRASLLPLVLELQGIEEALKNGDKSRLHDSLQHAHDLRSKLLQLRP